MALTPANAEPSPAAPDIGAIAYNPGARDDALEAGITGGARDQWRRATVQAVLALGLPDYGSIGRDPVDPVADLRTSTESFVTAAYVDFLDREPSAGELASRVAQVDAGGTRAFLRELSDSDEWTGALVTRFYQDTLAREPDPGGFAYWSSALRSERRTVAQAAAEFYASSEYYRELGGNTDQSWVTDLYQKLLGRAPDPGGLSYWVGQTSSRGRVSVAGRMYQSLESRRDRVTALYQALLARSPDRGGRDYWAGRILREGELALAVELASSSEYRTKAQARFP